MNKKSGSKKSNFSRHQKGQTSLSDFISELRICRLLAKDSVACLSYDQADTFEGKVGQGAANLEAAIAAAEEWAQLNLMHLAKP